jgi:hypothetical protein
LVVLRKSAICAAVTGGALIAPAAAAVHSVGATLHCAAAVLPQDCG